MIKMLIFAEKLLSDDPMGHLFVHFVMKNFEKNFKVPL